MHIAKILRKRTIVHFHPPGLFVLDNSSNKKKYKYLFEQADIVLVLSEQWKRWIEEKIQAQNNIRILYNPCPVVNRHDWEKKKNLILFAGSIIKRKGYDTLLKSFSMISSKHPNWKIIFAGNGEIEHGKQLAKKLNILDKTIWLGWVEGTDKERIFNEASIYCLASNGEGFPMGVLDAWAYGIPCVMTPVGGIPDIVEDGREGLIFPVGDSEKLAEKLEVLICDKSLRKSITTKTDKLVSVIFSKDVICKQLDWIYGELS